MAVAFVQATAIKVGTGVSTLTSNAFGSAVTAGNLITEAVSYGSNTGTSSNTPTDSKGNTHQIDKENTVATKAVLIGSANAVTGGTSFTVTGSLNGDTADMSIAAAEFSGADVSGTRVDTTVSATGTSTAPAAGSMTPANAGSLVEGAMQYDGADTTIGEAGWNLIAERESGSGAQPMSFIYNITGSAANPTWSLGASRTWRAVGVVYKPTGSADTLLGQAVM